MKGSDSIRGAEVGAYASLQHPVLDRSERIRAATTRLNVACLDSEWKGWHASYRFQCHLGHCFSSTIGSLTALKGCAQCREVGYIARLHELARAAGTTCLEECWLGRKMPHRFSCSKGHQWSRAGAYALRTAECPRCARQASGQRKHHVDGLQRLQQAAARKGGECMATVYAGVDQRYSFRCSHGHIWETVATKVLRGGWCKECSFESMRRGIEAARQMARARGGQCLSTSYRNVGTKLHWLCGRGHSWHTSLNAIRAGSWCPECANMARARGRPKALRSYRPHHAGSGVPIKRQAPEGEF